MQPYCRLSQTRMKQRTGSKQCVAHHTTLTYRAWFQYAATVSPHNLSMRWHGNQRQIMESSSTLSMAYDSSSWYMMTIWVTSGEWHHQVSLSRLDHSSSMRSKHVTSSHSCRKRSRNPNTTRIWNHGSAQTCSRLSWLMRWSRSRFSLALCS